MSRRPRIRSIKPEAWQDERIAGLSRDGRLLWVVLVTMADDEGRFRVVPSLILAHGYLYDRDAARRLNSWLQELSTSGLVALYEVGDHAFGVFPKWKLNQRISKPSKSVLPAPPSSILVAEPDERAA